MPTTRQGLISAAIEQLISQHVADAIAAYEANRNSGNGTQNEASGSAVVNLQAKYVKRVQAEYDENFKRNMLKISSEICKSSETCKIEFQAKYAVLTSSGICNFDFKRNMQL
ncbi:hypothetical protein Tco_0394225 [Tanacetum coccineum]